MTNFLFFKSKHVKRLGFSILMLLFCAGANAQITVSGKVSDASGPIPGANVLVKGSNNGAITNFDGEFTLNNVPSDGQLIFSFLGYKTKTVSINNQKQIDVTLEGDTEALNEVVVIGYGTQKAEAVTGSVVSIKANVLNEVKTSSFSQALQGRAAGVSVLNTGTRPGSAPTIRIRGDRSLSGDNNPLIVLNGIPFSGGLNDISNSDIATIDILKDASATAIYGSRGANGVILITTKTGAKGQKATVSYQGYYAIKEVFSKYDMMDAAQLTQLRADVASNREGVPIYDLGGDESLDNDTDWQDLLYGSSMQSSHDVSVKGGSEKGTYNIGMGYFKETSPLPGDSFERISLRAQVDQEIGAFRFGINSVQNFNKTSSISPLGLSASPLLSPFNADGSYNIPVRLQTQADDMWIPTRYEIDQIGEGRVNDQLDFGSYNNVYAEVKIPGVEGLKYLLNVGLNLRSSRDGNYTGQGVFNYNPTNNSTASYGSSLSREYIIENQILYDRTFAEKHKINFVGLYSTQQNEWDNVNLSVRNVPNPQSLYYNLDAALSEDITGYGTNYEATALQSWMGRVMYQYDNRYLLTATVRSDGSSRLAPGHKWHTYPAFSAGWIVSNEQFMENVNSVDLIKLRLGYGETSNQAVTPYSTQGRLSTRNYNFGSTYATGYFVSQLPNPNLGWEYSKTLNIGVDFGMFNGRLSGTVEYYNTNTHDILYGLALPPTSGVSSVTSNIGETQNKGFEITLNGTIIEKNGWTWDAGINFYKNTNEIVALATGEQENVGQLWFVGSPINVIYDYKNLGLWNESDPDYQYLQQYELGGNAGMIKVQYTGDYNADGSPTRAINSDDRVVQDPTPNFQGGFNTRVAYKNFDFSIVGAFQSGGIVISTLYSANGYLNLLTGRGNNVDVDYWTPTNTDAKYPAPGGIQSGDNPKYGSTLGLFDGSYLKVRAMTLGYNFSQEDIENLGVSNLRLYFSAQNPFVLFSPLYKESGLDPETNSGVDYNGNRENVAVNTTNISKGIPTIGVNAPTTRNFMLGLNFSF